MPNPPSSENSVNLSLVFVKQAKKGEGVRKDQDQGLRKESRRKAEPCRCWKAPSGKPPLQSPVKAKEAPAPTHFP